MKHRRISLVLTGVVYILCATAQNSFALVYSGGTGHTTAPSVDPGWDNVGVMSVGSGAYLGDGWVIAPYHVYAPNPSGGRYVDLDKRYYEIAGTAHRIKYDSSTNADLMMFRIEGAPDAPLVSISASSPLSKEVTVIATGRSRVGDLIDYGGGFTGYQATGGRAKRWGRNVTNGYLTTSSSRSGRTRTFLTNFDSPGLGDDECQLVNNDSGGSAFVESSPGSWDLAGLALSIGVSYMYSGPTITQNAVYGGYTNFANLAYYRPQIDSIRLIPLAGDADWDGDVDGRDIAIFKLTLGMTGADLQADFNGDNRVDLDDFAILRGNFGMISGTGVPGAENLPVQDVPEPATIALLMGAAPLLVRSRKRRAALRG